MSDFNVQCPKCRNRVVWRFFYPKTRAEYCCQLCGNTWKQPLEETQSQYGTFLGSWTGQEMARFENEISALNPDTDWMFFKGKKIYTAWQSMSPRLISTRSMDELIYWVALSTRDRNWYEVYRRLADKSFSALDVSCP